MHEIQWKDDYLSGVEEIDRQHREFVKLINRLNIIHSHGDNREYGLRLLTEVSKYAEYHFTSEENMMFLLKYPQLEEQQKAHKALLIKYRQWVESFISGKEVMEDIIRYLESWFADHTVNEDKKIGAFLNRRPVTPHGAAPA